MKQFVFLIVALAAVLCTSCKREPKINYLAGCDGIYIETKQGRLYGVESDGVIRIKPEWDNIGYGDLDGRVYQAWKGDKVILFDRWGKILCDTIPLVGKDKKEILYSENAPGTGMPQIASNAFALVHTEKGVFALYYDKDIAYWYQYGPFADFCGGATGYMFKDNATGKWGVAKYGDWIENEKPKTGWARWHFRYERFAVLIQPQYEKIISISYKRTASEGDYRGYSKESDIKWYAFDGTQWHAFDFFGHPTKVNNSELAMVRRLKPHQGKVKLTNIGDLITQRIGTEEASWVIIKTSWPLIN